MNWPIACVQLCFTLGWTVYVIFLPALLTRAGIDASWLPWILIVDQLLFAAADLAFGIWMDRSVQFFQKVATWLTALVLLSCAGFAALPFLAQSLPAWFFVCALFLWVLCSSVLRVPPLAMLGKFAVPSQPDTLHTPVAAYLFGLGIAGAIAPYLTGLLKHRDPLLPFIVASVALAMATLVLRRALVSAGAASSPSGMSGTIAAGTATPMPPTARRAIARQEARQPGAPSRLRTRQCRRGFCPRTFCIPSFRNVVSLGNKALSLGYHCAMHSEDIFILHPTAEQAVALKAFARALKIDFELATTDNIYTPAFVAKIKKSRRQVKKGKVTRVEKEDLETFLGLQ